MYFKNAINKSKLFTKGRIQNSHLPNTYIRYCKKRKPINAIIRIIKIIIVIIAGITANLREYINTYASYFSFKVKSVATEEKKNLIMKLVIYTLFY